MAAIAMLVLGSGLAGSCAARVTPPATGTPANATFSRQVALEGRSLTVHMQRGDMTHATVAILYATGDGGWRGKDRDVYRQMASWGYTVAGFSAPQFLARLPGAGGTATPARVGFDVARLIDATRDALRLPPTTRMVLVGVSRGADLMTVAAGQAGLRTELSGVVAVGLTREEEYVRRRQRPAVALDLYGYLPRLGGLPLAVIQSTRDRYLSAADARVLFGADTPVRRLHAVEARNHSFDGARPRLYALLRDSLQWIDRTPPSTPGPQP